MNLLKVKTKELNVIDNANGDILHAIKSSEKEFLSFGEAYFSKIKYKKIKAWKKHKKMTCNLIVPLGKVHFVCFEDNKQYFSETIGETNYKRITIPPGIWFGFMGLEDPYSLILNIADIEHDPKEMNKIEMQDISYDWDMNL